MVLLKGGSGLLLGRERGVERCGIDMVEVVADGLERDGHQEFHHLRLGESGGQKCVDRRRLGVAAFGNEFANQVNQRIRLLVAGRFAGADGGNGFAGDFLKRLGNGAVGGGAIAAAILQTRGEQGEVALLRREGGLFPFRIQRQIAFQHLGRMGKRRHEIGDEAKAFLDACHDWLGGFRRIGDGQGLK